MRVLRSMWQAWTSPRNQGLVAARALQLKVLTVALLAVGVWFIVNGGLLLGLVAIGAGLFGAWRWWRV